eukprot:COSAG01_NODE_74816_length_199_cov_2736.280000_1_plen_26_part_01
MYIRRFGVALDREMYDVLWATARPCV